MRWSGGLPRPWTQRCGEVIFSGRAHQGVPVRVSLLRGDLAQAREHTEVGAQGLSAPNLALPVLRATQMRSPWWKMAAWPRPTRRHRTPCRPRARELSHVGQLLLLGARARLRAAQGRRRDALADATTCGELYQQWGAARLLDVPWRLQAAEAHRRLGDREQGRPPLLLSTWGWRARSGSRVT